MAPGYQSVALLNKQQSTTIDTIDSFEILEQTVIKQKKLSKNKKNDLRLRILLKRTFDLVCEIMDRENGIGILDTTNETQDEDILLFEQELQLQDKSQPLNNDLEQQVPLVAVIHSKEDEYNSYQNHNIETTSIKKGVKRKHSDNDINCKIRDFKRLKPIDLNMKLNHQQLEC